MSPRLHPRRSPTPAQLAGAIAVLLLLPALFAGLLAWGWSVGR